MRRHVRVSSLVLSACCACGCANPPERITAPSFERQSPSAASSRRVAEDPFQLFSSTPGGLSAKSELATALRAIHGDERLVRARDAVKELASRSEETAVFVLATMRGTPSDALLRGMNVPDAAGVDEILSINVIALAKRGDTITSLYNVRPTETATDAPFRAFDGRPPLSRFTRHIETMNAYAVLAGSTTSSQLKAITDLKPRGASAVLKGASSWDGYSIAIMCRSDGRSTQTLAGVNPHFDSEDAGMTGFLEDFGRIFDPVIRRAAIEEAEEQEGTVHDR